MEFDPADPHVQGKYEPGRRFGARRHGLPFRDKLDIVRWLQKHYNLTHDQAMRDADSMERFLLQES